MPVINIINNSESTHHSPIQRSIRQSLIRLTRRYDQNINHVQDLQNIRDFLRANGNTSHYNIYRVAERALARAEFDNYYKHKILLFWHATNDSDQEIKSTIADRRTAFVAALQEAQRFRNALNAVDFEEGRIAFEDNNAYVDDSICIGGAINKLAEHFLSLHPDIEIVFDIDQTIYELQKAFIAEILFEAGFDVPMFSEVLVTLISLQRRTEIQNKIILCLGGMHNPSNLHGLIGDHEMQLLATYMRDDILELINFDGDIRTLIRNANIRYSNALAERALPAVRTSLVPSRTQQAAQIDHLYTPNYQNVIIENFRRMAAAVKAKDEQEAADLDALRIENLNRI